MINPYPPRYGTAFAFSSLLCPLPHQPALRRSLPPERRDIGFTMLRLRNDGWFSPCSHTGGRDCPCVPMRRWNNRPHRLLARACQHLWLVDIYGAYRSSHLLDLPPSLTPRPHLMLAVRETSSRSSPRPEGQGVLSRQLPTRPLPVSPVPLGYCGRNRRFTTEVSLFF